MFIIRYFTPVFIRKLSISKQYICFFILDENTDRADTSGKKYVRNILEYILRK